MKHSIEWHKNCLAKSVISIAKNREYAELLMLKVERMERDNRLKQAQIDLAIKEKKDGFDRDQYAIKRLSW